MSPLDLAPSERRELAEKMATCPFVGAAVSTGRLPVSGSRERPLALIADVGALGGGLDVLLRMFAWGNHSTVLDPAGGPETRAPHGMFSLQFGGSRGAHPGHSGILLGDPSSVAAGRFDGEAFERLLARGDERGRLSIAAVGAFIADNLRRDPNARVLAAFELLGDTGRFLIELMNAVVRRDQRVTTEQVEAFTKILGENNLLGSAGEWGLLFAFLHHSPRSRGWNIALDDVRALFVDKEFPDGWEAWPKSPLDWASATVALATQAALSYLTTSIAG